MSESDSKWQHLNVTTTFCNLINKGLLEVHLDNILLDNIKKDVPGVEAITNILL